MLNRLKRMMIHWLCFLVCVFSFQGIALAENNKNITFEEAGALAKDVKIPSFADYLTKESMNQTLPPTSFGDTSSLSDLRGEKGLGDIRTPGLNKAIACDTKTDPECLAIQMLRYGSANNPKFDETTEAQIKGEYTNTMGNKDAILGDLAGIGSKERVCETVESVIPGQSATEVCDITTATGSTQGTCEEGWEESKSLLVYYQCTMKALQTENRCDVITTAITHNEDIYQCTDREAVIENNACTVTTTPITHDQDIYECIDRKDVFEDNACTVTTTPITHDQDIYQCTDRKDVFEDKHCAVTTTALTHKEDIYQCTDRAATYENRTCDVPATVVVDKTYPYTCPITQAQAVKKSCVKTLNVVVTPLCSAKDPPQTEIRLNEYRTLYGWRPGSAYYGFQVIMECRASLDDFSVQFVVNGTVLGTVTSLPTRIVTDIKGFGIIIEARRTVINHEHVIEVDVTNVDTGKGSTTLSGTVVMETLTQQEHEVWSETCEAGG